MDTHIYTSICRLKEFKKLVKANTLIQNRVLFFNDWMLVIDA